MVGEIATAYVQLEARGGTALSSSVNRAMPTSTLNAAGQQGGNAYADGVGDGVGKSKGRLSSALGGALKLGAAGVAAGAVVGLSFLKGAYGAFNESKKVSALTASAIKATGGAANITADEVGALATAISKKTYVDDEMIQTGSNLLLTFKNVRNEAGKNNDVFNQATEAAVNLSAAGFGSVDGAAKMLGKALNDPVKGISAMSRAGVTFTEQQKKMIEKMVEGGDTLGAQKIILGEIEGQVGGAAAAQADAADKISLAWGNFQEDVGGKIAPVFDDIMSGAADGLGALSGLLNGEGLPRGGGPLSSAMDLISTHTQNILAVGRDVWDGLQAGWSELTESVGAILEEHGPMIEKVGGVLKDLSNTARKVLGPSLKWVAEHGLDLIGESAEFAFDTFKAGGNVMFGFSDIALTVMGAVVEGATDMAANVLDMFIRVAEGIDELPFGPDLRDEIAALGVTRDRVEGFGDTFQDVTDNVKAGLREQQWEWNLTAEEAARLDNRIRMLPDKVETIVNTPGAIDSYVKIQQLRKVYDLTPEEVLTAVQATGVPLTMRQITKLSRQVEMTPKQIALLVKQSGGVETVGDIRKVLKIADATDKKDIAMVLRALGIDTTVADFKKAKDAAMDVDKLRPRPKLGVDQGDFFGIFTRAAQQVRDLDGDTAHTYIVTHKIGGGAHGEGEGGADLDGRRTLTTTSTLPSPGFTPTSPRGGALRLVEGRVGFDESGDAYFRGLVREEIDADSDFHGTLVRMGR